MKHFADYICAAIWAGDQDGSVGVLCRNTSTEQVCFWHPRDKDGDVYRQWMEVAQ